MQNSQKNTCAEVPFYYFCRLKSRNLVKKGVRRKGFLVTLQNFSERLNNKQLRAPTSGITAILAIGLKALQTNFFVLCSLCRYDCRTKITKSPKKERARFYQKHCNKKCVYHQKFLIFHDIIDATVLFVLQIIQNHELVITSF